jgi:uncharacterized protein (DUF1697 family)
MTRYVALLRGINVGGKNLIPMAALKACFEGRGLSDVVTYIQSGNVVFGSDEQAAALVASLEAALSKAFGYDAAVVLRSRQQLRRVVAGAPAGFGTRPAQYRYDVVYLKEPLSAAEALPKVPTRPGVDQAFAGSGVLYFSRLVARAAESRLSRLVSLPVYKQMTVRNWNTTTRLLELLEAGGGR